MTSLLFHDLPPGPVPLYIGEPAEKVVETGLLVLDHVGRSVRFVQSDPFGPFKVPEHSALRFVLWEVDAMMPRWQLQELYGEARPLLERLQMGTTMSRSDTHWLRTRTPEAEAASALIDELTAQQVETAVDWVPAPRTVRRETALEKAIREAGGMTFADTRVAFLKGIQEREMTGAPIDISERHLRNVIAHGAIFPGGPNKSALVLDMATGSGKSHSTIAGLIRNAGSSARVSPATLKSLLSAADIDHVSAGVSQTRLLVAEEVRALRDEERRLRASPTKWSQLWKDSGSNRIGG